MESQRVHRLAATFAQVVSQRACAEQSASGASASGSCPSEQRIPLAGGTNPPLVRDSSCGKRPRDPTWHVVSFASFRRLSSMVGRAQFEHPTVHGLASNDSLQLTGGLRMLASLALT